jgi:phosphatidylglycerophosphatase A
MTAARPLSFWHPASLIATWFGTGLLPTAPGTWGTLAALPAAALIAALGGRWALLGAAAAAFLAGIWASERYASSLGIEDPGKIVIDEVAGMWLALVPLALNPMAYAIAFVFFRIFDIFKPWPANVLDRRVKGGLGIMIDDTVAAIYAAGASLAVLALLDP